MQEYHRLHDAGIGYIRIADLAACRYHAVWTMPSRGNWPKRPKTGRAIENRKSSGNSGKELQMLIHSMLARSTVNGPGKRAVVWLQGCDLRCAGCWNPSSHTFDQSRNRPVEEVGAWILSCPEIQGVTFSGGEPFQQAPELRLVCEYLRVKQPSLSIGLFTGYTLPELVQGRWHWRTSSGEWAHGNAHLFDQIRRFLDFAVCGRFRQTMVCSDKPLCGSRNQEVVFFSDRYSARDLEPQGSEINISLDGAQMTVTGFPPLELVHILSAK
jgi:anaerobic ribonucleoside-triphosphate reductase activating protein